MYSSLLFIGALKSADIFLLSSNKSRKKKVSTTIITDTCHFLSQEQNEKWHKTQILKSNRTQVQSHKQITENEILVLKLCKP